MSWLEKALIQSLLRWIQKWDRLRLAWLQHRHPGLQIHPTASTNFAVAHFDLRSGAELVIGPGVTTERLSGNLRIVVQEGARIEIEDDAWLCVDVGITLLRAYPGARIHVGRETILNGCMVTAKDEVDIGDCVMVGMGTRIFDSDQHALDSDRKEMTAPVRIGDYAWLAADVTVLRGVEVGDHSVVSTRSLVRNSIPPHRLAAGAPAQLYGQVGDRSKVFP